MENSGTPGPSAPSVSALTAAAARAAHLIIDEQPLIFSDPLAATLLGDRADELLAYHRRNGSHNVLTGARTTVTTRSRYTEDRLAEAIRGGVTQYVILGAGLDSFAYRSPLARRVRVIEVDHPGTQRWKRGRLTASGLVPEGDVRYAEADLEAGSLAARLAGAGFDFSRPALVSWLGVTMYLTVPAIAATLAVLGRCAPGTELIVEYAVPDDLQDDRGREYARLVAAALAERGEPWLTFLPPAEMSALLGRHGFADVTHAGAREMVDAGLWERSDALQPSRVFQLADARVR